MTSYLSNDPCGALRAPTAALELQIGFPSLKGKTFQNWHFQLSLKIGITGQSWTLLIETSPKVCSDFKIEPQKYKNQLLTYLGIRGLLVKRASQTGCHWLKLRSPLASECRNKFWADLGNYCTQMGGSNSPWAEEAYKVTHEPREDWNSVKPMASGSLRPRVACCHPRLQQ